MQRKLTAFIMACTVAFASIHLCVQAENNLDFTVESAVEYSAENEAISTDSHSEASLFALFEGEGTEENPYILSKPQDFALLAVMVNNGNTLYNSAYYKLNNSIDFKDVTSYLPIGKVETKLDYPGEGDFAQYKAGTYSLSAGLDASIDTEYGQIDVGSELLSSASVTIEKSGNATVKLNFGTAEINLSDDVTAKFFVSDAYGTNGVETTGTIGYQKNDGTWVDSSTDSNNVSISRSSASDTVVPSYTLSEGTSGVNYVTQISFPFDVKKDTYSLALAIDSNVVGAQLGGETENPVTLNINWSAFSASVYSESEYVEKITAEYPFSGHFDGNGYALKNITISSSERLIGIFGLGSNASVENLRIENITINGERDRTMNIGGLFGRYDGNWESENKYITGCHVDGRINVNGGLNVEVGGMIGKLNVVLSAAQINNCRADVDIHSVTKTVSYVGGLIANVETGVDLSKCVVTGTAYGEATGDASSYVGGVVARFRYNDWIGVSSLAGDQSASLMTQKGYTSASNIVSSIKIEAQAKYSKYIGNTIAQYYTDEATVEKCYSDAEYAVEASGNAYEDTNMPASELFDKSFLADTVGLDFDNTWIMVLGKPDLISKDPYIAYEAEGSSIEIQPVNCGDCYVYAAAYGTDGRVAAARIASYTEGNPVSVSFDGVEYETVKIFALDDSFKPLCEAKTITE